MTKKKMCQWIDRCFYRHNRTMLVDKSVCPKGVNDKCELIPAKPKVRRVKAWAIIWDGLPIAAYKTKRPLCSAPCTITIAAKYLKPAKGKGE